MEEIERLRLKEQEKEDRKNARAKRKRLPKRDPVTEKIYNRLMNKVTRIDYRSVQLWIAVLLLNIKGIRINELFSLKVQ